MRQSFKKIILFCFPTLRQCLDGIVSLWCPGTPFMVTVHIVCSLGLLTQQHEHFCSSDVLWFGDVECHLHVPKTGCSLVFGVCLPSMCIWDLPGVLYQFSWDSCTTSSQHNKRRGQDCEPYGQSFKDCIYFYSLLFAFPWVMVLVVLIQNWVYSWA
jgi:hypothetical protein